MYSQKEQSEEIIVDQQHRNCDNERSRTQALVNYIFNPLLSCAPTLRREGYCGKTSSAPLRQNFQSLVVALSTPSAAFWLSFASIASAFEKIKKEMGDAKLAAAIYNIGEGFVRMPFLDLSEKKFKAVGSPMGMLTSQYSRAVS
jgi:hypothetical protein